MDAGIKAASDEDLAAIAAARASERVCAELFRRYQQRIYLWSFNYTHDVEEAVDCSQEIFLKIFRSIAGFAGRSSFATWVYAITRNHCLGELSRKREQWRRRLVSIDDLDVADSTCATDVHQIELKGDLERFLARAQDKMKEEELEAFVLHYREGLTVKEITKVLGCENVTGARTLIQNARRKFKRLAQGRVYSDGEEKA
jgi:RNA polymerase sigma-70 factor (ECF subfamily)